MNASPMRKLGAALSRNFGLFVLSFLLSAMVNMVPQLFFARAAPDDKELLLSVLLLSGTAAAWLGVYLSGRTSAPRAQLSALRTAALGAGLLLIGLCFGAVFLTLSVALVLALNLGIRFAANYGINSLDALAIAAAERDGARELNDQVGTAYRLLANLVAPLYFGLCFARTGLTLSLVALMLLAAFLGAAPLLRQGLRPSAPEQAREPSPAMSMSAALSITAPRASLGLETELRTSDRLILRYALFIYASLYVFSADLVYLLGDYLQLANATRLSGLVMLVTFTSAIGLVALRPVLLARLGVDAAKLDTPHRLRRRLMLPVVGIVVPSFAYVFGLIQGPLGALVWATAFGFAYGSFQYDVRAYITRAQARSGGSGLITRYNNVANTSALLAFSLMVPLCTLLEGQTLHRALLGLVIMLVACAARPGWWALSRA